MNVATVLMSITQGTNVITALTPVLIGVALEIRRKLSADSAGEPFEVQIMTLRNGTVVAVEEADQIIAEYRRTHPK